MAIDIAKIAKMSESVVVEAGASSADGNTPYAIAQVIVQTLKAFGFTWETANGKTAIDILQHMLYNYSTNGKIDGTRRGKGGQAHKYSDEAVETYVAKYVAQYVANHGGFPKTDVKVAK